MSTRAMICVDQLGHERCYELYYRHCDGYPTGLGIELINAMLKHNSIEEIIKDVGASAESRSINEPEDAFLQLQSDLEWIYVIRNGAHSDTMSLQIYKTSCPYTKRNFAWPVWFSYKVYMKRKRALLEMSVIELTASNTLYALHEFEKARPDAKPKKSEHVLDKEESQGEFKAGGQKISSTDSARDELARYTACVFEPTDIIEIRRLPSGKCTWHQAGELAAAVESLAWDNQQKQHIYIGANTRRARGGTKSTDVACAYCLFVDFDGITADDAKYRWNNTGLPTPTITIASGHGVHAYWRLTEPITDMKLWSKLQKKLIALLDSDSAIHDPARIMRLPGFTNHKEPISACNIIDADRTRTYKLKSLLTLLNSAVTKSKERALQAANNFAVLSKKQLNNKISPTKIAELTAVKWPAVTKGGRNCKTFQNSAYLLKNLGLTQEQALPILQQWNRRNRPPLPEWELRQVLRNANIYGGRQVDKRC